MKTNLTALTLTLTLTTSACGTQPRPRPEQASVVEGVRLEKVAAAPIDDFHDATGTIRAGTSTVLSARIMGTVTSVSVREGDRVRQGQTVVEIENREADAQLEKEKAGLRQAEEGIVEVDESIAAAKSAQAAAEASRRLAASTLSRYQNLLDRKSVSPQEFDEVKTRSQVADAEAERANRTLLVLDARKKQMMAQIEQARSDVSRAQVLVGYAHVTSPMSGIVTSKRVEIGSTATPGTPLVTIEDTGRYRLEAVVEESQIGRIKLRDAVRVHVDAIGAQDLRGVVAEILPATDPMSRSYTVKIDIASAAAQKELRSGLYGTARFLSGQRRVLTVPRNAMVQRGPLTGVFVPDDAGTARLRLITAGKTFGDRVEVLSGLSEGESIVVDGIAAVSDGSRVR